MSEEIKTVSAEEAIEIMLGLSNPMIFRDRGWGDHREKANITIINDGNGNAPLAAITQETYEILLKHPQVMPNSYSGFKARRIHDFKKEPVSPEDLKEYKEKLAAGRERVRSAAGMYGKSWAP